MDAARSSAAPLDPLVCPVYAPGVPTFSMLVGKEECTGQTSFGGSAVNPESMQTSKNIGAAAFTLLRPGDWIYV